MGVGQPVDVHQQVQRFEVGSVKDSDMLALPIEQVKHRSLIRPSGRRGELVL